MGVAGRGAVRHHRDRQVGGMGRIIEHFDIQHGGQTAETLCADAERVDLLVQLDAQFLGAILGTPSDQLLNIDRRHQRFLGQHERLFRRAADTDAENARRTPARAHQRHGLQHPVHQIVGRVEHGEFGFGFRTAALGRADHLDMMTGNDFVMHHCRSVVLGILALAGRIAQHRGAQLVVRIEIRPAHALIDHLLHRQRGIPMHVHADLEEHQRDAGILADRAVALGAHPRVDQNLRDGVLGGRAFLALVGLRQRLDVIDGMVVADVLEGVGDALDEIFLANGGHDISNGARNQAQSRARNGLWR
jgi:hypothetical protein